ncbi:MAG: hypothetical protein ABIT38_19830 [Gemmatimonadaceae bacterium]
MSGDATAPGDLVSFYWTLLRDWVPLLALATDAPIATTTLTIRATGTGVTDATKTVDLTVTAPAVGSIPPAYGVSSMLALAR